MKFLLIGLGAVGVTIPSLLIKHGFATAEDINVIAADDEHAKEAAAMGVKFEIVKLDRDNYRQEISNRLSNGGFLINLSIGVSSCDLIRWCQENDVFYLDTCIEPWASDGSHHGYDGTEETSNYKLREQALGLIKEYGKSGRTSVIAHGMNPGIITYLVKDAMTLIKDRLRIKTNDVSDWSGLAQKANITKLMLNEYDTQDDGTPYRAGELCNSWSARGLYSEAIVQKAEYAPFTETEGGANIGLIARSPAMPSWYQTAWAPYSDSFLGRAVAHHEVASIGSLFHKWCPEIFFTYRPCPKAATAIYSSTRFHIDRFRLLNFDTTHGYDEIGVDVEFNGGKRLWVGVVQTADNARKLVPYSNATTAQVAGGIIAAIKWAVKNPFCGIVEAEDMPYEEVLQNAFPYLGVKNTVWRDI